MLGEEAYHREGREISDRQTGRWPKIRLLSEECRASVCFIDFITIEVGAGDGRARVQDGDARHDVVEAREEAITPDTTNGVVGWGSRPTQHRAARRDTKEISRPPCWRWLRDDRGLTIM